jgi:RNA polymerase sigma-70 factor (ECF subfamily)
VQRWQYRLVNLAYRFCRDSALAEAWRKKPSSRPSVRWRRSAFSTWLMAIALNTYRSRLLAEGQPLVSLDLARTLSTEMSVLRSLIESQHAEVVRKAVLTLPARYREAILLYYFEDKSVGDAARVLGIAEGTLKARLHRGRELLKQKCNSLSPVATGPPVEEQ